MEIKKFLRDTKVKKVNKLLSDLGENFKVSSEGNKRNYPYESELLSLKYVNLNLDEKLCAEVDKKIANLEKVDLRFELLYFTAQRTYTEDNVEVLKPNELVHKLGVVENPDYEKEVSLYMKLAKKHFDEKGYKTNTVGNFITLVGNGSIKPKSNQNRMKKIPLKQLPIYVGIVVK